MKIKVHIKYLNGESTEVEITAQWNQLRGFWHLPPLDLPNGIDGIKEITVKPIHATAQIPWR
jgi:hypothetical protein